MSAGAIRIMTTDYADARLSLPYGQLIEWADDGELPDGIAAASRPFTEARNAERTIARLTRKSFAPLEAPAPDDTTPVDAAQIKALFGIEPEQLGTLVAAYNFPKPLGVRTRTVGSVFSLNRKEVRASTWDRAAIGQWLRQVRADLGPLLAKRS